MNKNIHGDFQICISVPLSFSRQICSVAVLKINDPWFKFFTSSHHDCYYHLMEIRNHLVEISRLVDSKSMLEGRLFRILMTRRYFDKAV